METRDESFVRAARAIRRLFHQLRAIAEAVSPPTRGFSASHRAVLESLSAHGASTVPALARARPVARQHIQTLVNDLLAAKLVETLSNPAHKRSPLVALTPAGKRRFDEIRRNERALLRRAKLPLSAQELRGLADQLEVLSEGLHELVGQASKPLT